MWGNAEEVPGLTALNVTGAAVSSISCASAGECSAGGFYVDSGGRPQSLVANEVNGVWGSAEEVPGSGTLNVGGDSEISSLSCGSPGNCSAGGEYFDGSSFSQALVVSEVNGVWGNALELPGSATLNAGGNAHVFSVSCRSPGNCSAGGEYTDGTGNGEAFVANEVNGVWGNAIEVPGSGTLNVNGAGAVLSLSCGSAGNCSAGGFYEDSTPHDQPFVVSEVKGVWKTAIQAPGSGTLNVSGNSAVNALSCGSPGSCSAAGTYRDGSGQGQIFVANQVNGVWGNAIEVPGSGTLNADGNANVTSVSCPTAGNCAMGGNYRDGAGKNQAFVANEVNGVWGNVIEVPGSGTLNANGDASIDSVSCATPGNCSAGGNYRDGAAHTQAFEVNEVNGVWGHAAEIPGSGTLNAGGSAFPDTISCAAPGNCSTGGTYLDGHGVLLAFVANETESSTAVAVSPAKLSFGQPDAVKVTITPAWASGKVTVTARAASGTPISLCAITAKAGKASCDLAAGELNAGRYKLVAVYSGTKILPGSTSSATPLTVSAAKSTTALTLSAATISHKHEPSEKLTVLVHPQFIGTPTGTVTITAKPAKGKPVQVCKISLVRGKNTCHLAAKRLGPGSYQVTATYSGSVDFGPSTSVKKTLKVTK
ncbi:MAG TPA: Ig-like domain-containing protein [Streptosporangiaceae bacterium]|nr:Ig-like domain-containing protein [Streptosporangiaceae bacterium]